MSVRLNHLKSVMAMHMKPACLTAKLVCPDLSRPDQSLHPSTVIPFAAGLATPDVTRLLSRIGSTQYVTTAGTRAAVSWPLTQFTKLMNRHRRAPPAASAPSTAAMCLPCQVKLAGAGCGQTLSTCVRASNGNCPWLELSWK